PGMPPQMQPSHQQATMIAQPSPFAQGVPQGGMTQPGPQGQGGFQPASPMQKTIVAMAAPQLGQMQPGQSPPRYPPMNSMEPNAAHRPNKTVMLQGSEGVVSVARTGQAVQPVGTGGVEQGASTLFWIVSLVIGVA